MKLVIFALKVGAVSYCTCWRSETFLRDVVQVISLSCRHRDLSTPSYRIIVLRGRSSLFFSTAENREEIEIYTSPVSD